MNTPGRLNNPPKGIGWIIGILLFACLATLAYWVVFFTSGDVQVRQDEVYLAFENAFPLADAWMAACALLGALGLWRRRAWGFLFGLLGASSAIFLGLLDLLFDLNEGILSAGGVEAAIEIAIILVSLVLGPVVIVYLWKNRFALACI
ncbi:MAG: hypothetical protein ACWGO1_08585 [Anaerolineales bacterium]